MYNFGDVSSKKILINDFSDIFKFSYILYRVNSITKNIVYKINYDSF